MAHARRVKGKNTGSMSFNPPRRDCIGWTDKKTGNLIFREDYENEQYNKYVRSVEDSQGISDTALSKSEFLKEVLWASK